MQFPLPLPLPPPWPTTAWRSGEACDIVLDHRRDARRLMANGLDAYKEEGGKRRLPGAAAAMS